MISLEWQWRVLYTPGWTATVHLPFIFYFKRQKNQIKIWNRHVSSKDYNSSRSCDGLGVKYSTQVLCIWQLLGAWWCSFHQWTYPLMSAGPKSAARRWGLEEGGSLVTRPGKNVPSPLSLPPLPRVTSFPLPGPSPIFFLTWSQLTMYWNHDPQSFLLYVVCVRHFIGR